MEVFAASRSADGELMWVDGGGKLGCYVFGDGCGNDAARDGAAGYGADVFVGFEEWYYAGGGEGVEGVLVDFVGG